MANEIIKAETLVLTGLGVLERELVLPRLITTNPPGLNFVGARDDTVTFRVETYLTARERVLRSATALTFDEFAETTIAVQLDTQAYKGINVTLEELTLDVSNFAQQIAIPATTAVARKLEDIAVLAMEGATYDNEVTLDPDDPWLGIVDARALLNMANVPISGRFLAVGSNVEAAFLKSNRISHVDLSGSDSALRDATIGRLAGFTAVTVPAMDPDTAVAGHVSAFLLATKAPAAPAGASASASASFGGFAMSVIQDYDPINQKDRFSVSIFAGTGLTQDHGSFDSAGRFVPAEDPDTANGTDLVLARAVKLTLGS